MGGGGGNPIVNAISTVATAFAAPVVGTVALAKEVAGDEAAAKVDAVPIVGTVSQGITASGQLYGDAATGVATGDFSELRKDAVPAAKMGAVVAAAYGGASLLGATAVVPAAQFGDMVAKKGVDVGTLAGAAASYFGNDLASYGIDVNKFLPKPNAEGYGSGKGSVYSRPVSFAEGLPSEKSYTTLFLVGAAMVVFILAMKKRGK